MRTETDLKAPETFTDISDVDHGLSARHLAAIRRILEPWANRITAVEVFGSRATGAYRPNSDLDLLLHGDLDHRAIDRLWTLFHESSRRDVLRPDHARAASRTHGPRPPTSVRMHQRQPER